MYFSFLESWSVFRSRGDDVRNTIAQFGSVSRVTFGHFFGQLHVSLFGRIVVLGEFFCYHKLGDVDVVLEEICDDLFRVVYCSIRIPKNYKYKKKQKYR